MAAAPARAVLAESSASAAQGGRRLALEGALAEAVRIVASRHVTPAERQAHEAQFRAVLASPSQYVRRYSIQAESADADVARVRVAADVDRDTLLADLEKAGVAVRRLAVFPRVLVGATPSAPRAAELLLLRLREEGIDARLLPQEGDAAPTPESLRAAATAAGFHVAAYLAVGAQALPSLPVPGVVAPDQPVEIDLEVGMGGGLLDARTGEWLSRGEEKRFTRGQSPEEAAAQGVEQCAEALAQRFLEDLFLSGWTPGTEREELEIRIAGLDSPGLVPLLQRALAESAEFQGVRLDRIEAGAAVWRVTALRSGFSWGAVLGALNVPGGGVAWVPAPANAARKPGEPARVDGRWVAR